MRSKRVAQALVEFALAISTFMLLILGTFDLARAHLAYTVVSNAAREAGRYGAAHETEAGWQASAVQTGKALAIGIDPDLLSLTATTITIDALPYVRISGTYPFRSLTPFVSALLGDPITIRVETSQLVG